VTKTPLVALVAALALLAAGCSSEKAVDLAGTPADGAFTIAKDALTTDEGKPYSLATDTTEPLTLVFFGYTHCPDICPTVLASMASGLAKLTSAQRKQVQVLFITSDPDRDTGPVLRDYLRRFDPSFLGLTGPLPTIAKVGKSIGIFVDEGEELSGGGYDPNSHGSYVIGINDKHEALIVWGGDTAPSEFAQDIRFLLTERPEKLRSGTEVG
jgi:protein SCO1/2